MTQIYNELIQTSARDHLPGVDWRLLKAQLMQESGLDPSAVSRVGARGIAQFMPGTWSEVTKKMNIVDADVHDTYYAIPACAYYMRELHDQWTAPRPAVDRYCLTLASYNAGLGSLLKAQKKAGGANDYKSIISQMHHITGNANASETRNYVRRIYSYWLGYVIG